MAIGTTAAIIGGLGAAGGAAQSIIGANQARDARRAIDNFQRADLVNPAENLRISTLGADLQREQANRAQSNIIDAIRMGGSRAIIGAAPALAAQSNLLNREIAAGLDQQMLNREAAIADGAFRVQQLQERRDEADLRGLGNLYNVGQQNLFGGFDDIATAGMFIGQNLEGNQNRTPFVAPIPTFGGYGLAQVGSPINAPVLTQLPT